MSGGGGLKHKQPVALSCQEKKGTNGMRRFQFQSLRTWSTLAVVGAAASVASAQPTLTQLNSGPSSATIPSVNDSTVMTFTFPREVVNIAVTEVPSGTLDGSSAANGALSVQTGTTAGFRYRSRATFPESSQANAAAALELIGNTNAAGVAANSFVFIGRSTDLGTGAGQIGNTITSLLAFIAAGTEGNQFFQIPFSAYSALDTDGEVTETDLNGGVPVLLSDFYAADPDGGGALTAGSYRFNGTYDIVLFALDTGGSADPDVVTEFAYLPRSGVNTTPSLAATGTSSTSIADIRILANRQLIDDSGDNGADTVAGSLTAADDFLVGTTATGGSTQSLSAFLAGLTGAPTATGFTVTGTGNSDFNRVITVNLSAPITNTTDIATIRGRFIGFTPGAASGEVFGFHGGLPANTSFSQMALAGTLDITQARLLQGSGTGSSEVWVAVDASGSLTSAGSGDQFELFVTRNGEEIVVATGNAAQLTLPTTGEIPGIDDTNLDGTADDAVIAVGSSRVFVEFTVDDGDDSINSDGTWSDDGEFDNHNRDERFPLSIRPTGNGTAASNALGSAIGGNTEVALGDLARPQIIGYCTQALGTNDPLELCEVADNLFIVFDEAVALNTTPANRVGVRYVPGIDISDLTAGLTGTLGIREATTASSSATLSGLITPTPTPALGEFAIENDSVGIVSPLIPLTEDAADGTTAATGIRPGTGFIGGDSPYILAADNNLVTTTGVGGVTLGNIITPGATFTTNALSAGGVFVDDCAPPALVAANAVDDNSNDFLDLITYGMSEDVDTDGPATSEAESYVFIMANDTAGRRENLIDASISFFGDNTFAVFLDDELDPDDAADPGFVTAIFNPGFTIEDDENNAIDPNAAKTKLVDIGRPSATFKNKGVATVDPDSDKVVSFMIKTTGAVALSEDGTLTDLLDRFFVRGGRDLNDDGDFDDFGESSGEALQLAGLVDDIEIGAEADPDGCYTITLTFMSGMPFPQESFACEYVDADDQTGPVDSFLVDADQPDQEIPSAIMSIRVIRAPVVEGDETDPSGNILGMTIGGVLNLGEGENALGAEVSAWVWKPIGGTGEISFTYKGVRYTGFIDLLDGDGADLIATGTVLYFHPQLQGPGGLGTMEPGGVINSSPDLDLYQTIEVEGTQPVGGGVSGTVGTSTNIPLYQNLAPQFAVNPIALTFTRATTTTAASGNVGAFTFLGTGVTNGRVTSEGRFEFIGDTVVTGEADEDGGRPYLIHTYGQKDLKGCPVIIVVCPEEFFSNLDPFLANNFFANRLLFMSDFEGRAGTTTTASTLPPRAFPINRSQIWSHNVDDLVFDDWGIFPIASRNGGVDIGATFPNRFSGPGTTAGSLTTVNSTAPFPSGFDARGFFVFLDKDDCEPYLPTIVTALAIDSTGVYCGDIGRLTRVVAGYSYALEFDSGFGSDDCWFTFGARLSETSGGVLVLANNATNGGWNLTANLRSSQVTANSLPGQIAITLDNDDENGNGAGVRIGGDSVGSSFSDLTNVAAGQGVLLHQTDTTANNPSN